MNTDTRTTEEKAIAVITNAGFEARKLMRDLKPELGNGLWLRLIFIINEAETYLALHGKTLPRLTSFD